MKKFQKLFVAGTSLLVICFMAIAGVLALGNITRQISITIHYESDIRAEVWAATYSGAEGKLYGHEQILTHDAADAADFSTTGAKNLYERTDKDNAAVIAKANEFATNGGFKFTEDGVLEIYFLIKNLENQQLTYYTVVTYGDLVGPIEDNLGAPEATYIELVPYVAPGEGEDADVTKSTPLGTAGDPNYVVANEKVGEANVPGLSLVKLVFNIKDLPMTPSFDTEKININLWIDRDEAPVEP